MALIEDLNWRHAVKAYDPTRKVKQEDIDKIVEAARLAPTSSGLQPFKLIVVENQDIKNQLSEGSLNPECMREASHILILRPGTDILKNALTKFTISLQMKEICHAVVFESYTDKLKSIYLAEEAEKNFAHTSRQTYIALGLALAQAAELKVDTTPVEGFDNAVITRFFSLIT
ncbi:nitroreductase family protein [Flavobacterium branchiarum]|uniref:nitroreductase family protein n=1 Tax=Flavobacterium branchiarum TaxID=1114870 RepID=UPI0025B4840A|nr:nitroreductase family protein [Flavobacterium branchiarum]MDN3673748.1 nitroreductase family protein [Flavobacterium branchiarum]